MMQITITLNGTKISPEIEPDTLLIDLVRSQGCYSVKRGCETANCGLCTVFLDEKCGFCNPGFIMNALALFREKEFPEEDEIREYLAGNLCRCSGYEGQLRGILAFLDWKREKQKEAAE